MAARIVLAVLLVAAGAAWYELRTYRRHVIYLERMDANWIDLTLAFLSLWGRSLLWLALPTALALGLAARGRRRLATVSSVTASMACMLWFVLDARLMRLTGAHISTYLGFAWEPGGREWGGDVRPVSMPLLRVALGGLGFFAVVWAAVFHAARLPGLGRLAVRRLGPAATVYVLVPTLLLTGRGFVDQPAVLEQLYEVMPGRTPLNDPARIPGAGTTGFGVAADEAFDSAARLFERRMQAPADVAFEQVRAPRAERPHVVLFILESFRHDAITPERMPRLAAWAQRGLVLERHYAGSNRSDMGTYALTHGRWPIEYEQRTHDPSRSLPALLRLFNAADYSTTLIGSCPFTWQGMDAYFSAPPFDSQLIHAGDLTWPERDRKSIAAVRRTLDESGGRPQLIVVFLMSTHWSYEFPAAYAQGKNVAPVTHWNDRDGVNLRAMRTRYEASLRFLDDEIGGLVETLSPKTHLVMVTGDHGESFREDGVIAHATKLSDAQSRTSFVAVGTGFEPAHRTAVSLHLDLVPTLAAWLHPGGITVRHASGVDRRAPGGARDIALFSPLDGIWHIALLRGPRRLMLRYRVDRLLGPHLRVVGFCDPEAFITPELAGTPDTIPAWTRSFETLLRGD